MGWVKTWKQHIGNNLKRLSPSVLVKILTKIKNAERGRKEVLSEDSEFSFSQVIRGVNRSLVTARNMVLKHRSGLKVNYESPQHFDIRKEHRN